MEDLDDLFTDQLNEQLQDQLEIAPPVAAPPGLSERIDDLRLNGCCDKITWSKIGCVAYVARNRREIRTCSLRFQESSGTWTKADYTHPQFPADLSAAYKGRELAHISWNPNALDLLASDVCGRIVIFVVQVAINRLTAVKVINIDQDDSLNALVGLAWLNTKRPVPLGRPGMRAEGQWRYPLMQVEPRGPYNPWTRSAFVAVTRGGTVRLAYQIPDSQYQAVKHDLDGFSTSTDVLTHAALCPDKDDMILLAVHTFSKQIRLYSMKIDWHIKAGEPVPSNIPTLAFQHLTTIDPCLPIVHPTFGSSPAEPELSRLDLIPRGIDGRGEPPSSPKVLVTFSCMLGQEQETDGRTSHTILSSWELREELPAIDASFSQLASKKSSNSELKPEKTLKKLDDIRLDQVVLGIQILQHNTIVALATSDGGVEFRNRNLQLLPADETPDRVTSLSQIGFSFSNQKPCLHTVLSPNAVIKAYFGKDNEVHFSTMRLPVEMVDLGGIATIDKISAAFVMQNAIAEAVFNGNSTNDDLVMTMSQFLEELLEEQRSTIQFTFLRDIYKVLGMYDKLVDMSQFDKTVRTGVIARCWSIQAALGNHGDKLNRTLPSKLAWVALNLRNIACSFMMAFFSNRPSANGPGGANAAPPGEPDINKPETLQYLTTLIAWYIKLTDHVIDHLFDLNRILGIPPSSSSSPSVPLDGVALRSQVALLNDPSLLCFLCTFTRYLFRHNIRGLRSLIPYTQKPAALPPSPTAPYYEALLGAFRSSTISPSFIDAMLAEVESLVQKAYAPLSEAQRIECELKMMVHGEIPDVLLPIAKIILGSFVERLRQASSSNNAEAELAFRDWSSLGVSDDARTKRWKREVLFDGIRKKELVVRGGSGVAAAAVSGGAGLRVRTCTRCGCLMEDLLPQRGQRLSWMMNLFRTCFCGGHFLVERSVEDAVKLKVG